MLNRKLLEEFDDNEEFARLLEESERNEEKGQIKIGKVIAVREYGVLVDVGEKVEGFLGLSEIADKSGNISLKVGDDIEVFVSSSRGERPNISHKKASRISKIQAKIKELGNNFKDFVVEGKVISKNKGGFVIESDGVEYFMPKYAAAFKDTPKAVGQKVRACIIDVRPNENSIIISRKRFFEIDDIRQAEGLDKLKDKDKIYDGVVRSITSFGMFVEVEGVKGLVHYTEISHRGPVNPAKIYKEGDKVSVKIIQLDEDKKRLSFSIKATSQDPWQEVQKELQKGYTIKVVVTNIEPYGAFVDIGNDVEGFLHISEISWDKEIKHPADYLKVGQEIDVEIIEIDTKTRRLRVSLKNLLPKPFTNFAKTHKVNDTIKGKVATITDFGAFIRLGEIDGLLHNEDFSWQKGLKCKENLKVGDEIEVCIVKIDTANERVTLSKKALEESPVQAFAKSHKIDEILKGKIIDIKDFGVFIKVDDMDALIKNEDLYPLKKEELKIDDEIEGVLLSIDKNTGRIRVSVKRLDKQKQKDELKAFNSSSANDDKMTLGDKLKNKIGTPK
ncbi:30S ribosomal protein S1 [Helicobacter sp. T3_23-1059]